MKRCLSLLMIALCSTGAWGASARPDLTLVKATHPPVTRHKAHKATKHKAPKRHRHAV